MMPPATEPEVKTARKLLFSIECGSIIFLYVAALISVKLSFTFSNWAARDARDFHFPVINYFIENGFKVDYPQFIAMLPGMHVYFALASKLFHLGTLYWNGTAAFLIQSVFGIFYILGLLLVYISRDEDDVTNWRLLVGLFCSTFAFYSWLWPSTDLCPIAAYAAMIFILKQASVVNLKTSLCYAILILLASSFRQNYAFLGIAYGLYYMASAPNVFFSKPVKNIALSALPVAAGGIIIAVAFWLWGALTPPTERRHGSGFELHFQSWIHVIAYTGYLCWPLCIVIVDRLANHKRSIAVFGVSLALALIVVLLVPLSESIPDGRAQSPVWMVAGKAPISMWRYIILYGLFTVGFFIWINAFILTVKGKIIKPELVLLLVYCVALLAQKQAWQRYLEPIALISFVSFFRLSSKKGFLRDLWYIGGFSLHFLLSFGFGLLYLPKL